MTHTKERLPKDLWRYFGAPETRNLQELCTVAFEPNPQHTEHLESLAANYSTCGIRWSLKLLIVMCWISELWLLPRLGSVRKTPWGTLRPTSPSKIWTSCTGWLQGDLVTSRDILGRIKLFLSPVGSCPLSRPWRTWRRLTLSAGRRFQPTHLSRNYSWHYQVMPIKMMRLAKFITEVVATRKLPLSAKVTKPR